MESIYHMTYDYDFFPYKVEFPVYLFLHRFAVIAFYFAQHSTQVAFMFLHNRECERGQKRWREQKK